MNVLPLEKKTAILAQLVEGLSVRSIERLTGTHRDTILRVLSEAGERAQSILDTELVNLESNFIQVDEIWTFVAKKQKRLTREERISGELGDQYIFVALDPQTKLVSSFTIGKRNLEVATSFLKDLRDRIITRFQLSSDSFKPYFNAVDSVFGEDVDYGQVHKKYADEDQKGSHRYSPACIVSVFVKSLIGQPIRKHISTSLVERQNLTMRMNMRRFTRLTNAFSKKLDNLRASVALHFFHYNFMRIHSSLRVTPAMEARVTNRIWNFEELLKYNQRSQAA
jgi:IS1 family transposase